MANWLVNVKENGSGFSYMLDIEGQKLVVCAYDDSDLLDLFLESDELMELIEDDINALERDIYLYRCQDEYVSYDIEDLKEMHKDEVLLEEVKLRKMYHEMKKNDFDHLLDDFSDEDDDAFVDMYKEKQDTHSGKEEKYPDSLMKNSLNPMVLSDNIFEWTGNEEGPDFEEKVVDFKSENSFCNNITEYARNRDDYMKKLSLSGFLAVFFRSMVKVKQKIPWSVFCIVKGFVEHVAFDPRERKIKTSSKKVSEYSSENVKIGLLFRDWCIFNEIKFRDKCTRIYSLKENFWLYVIEDNIRRYYDEEGIDDFRDEKVRIKHGELGNVVVIKKKRIRSYKMHVIDRSNFLEKFDSSRYEKEGVNWRAMLASPQWIGVFKKLHVSSFRCSSIITHSLLLELYEGSFYLNYCLSESFLKMEEILRRGDRHMILNRRNFLSYIRNHPDLWKVKSYYPWVSVLSTENLFFFVSNHGLRKTSVKEVRGEDMI